MSRGMSNQAMMGGWINWQGILSRIYGPQGVFHD